MPPTARAIDDGNVPLNAGAPHENIVEDDTSAPPAAHLNHALAVQGELPVGSAARSALPDAGEADR